MAKRVDNRDLSDPRMFHYSDGKSNKFWEIALGQTSHTVRYGRIGAAGRITTKDFSSEDKARASYDKLVEAKLEKGYVEVDQFAQVEPESEEESGEDKEEPEPGAGKLHEPFLVAIQNDPDNFEPYAIYADWLTERGDPRGEFIHLQWQLEDENCKGEERKKVVAAEKKLLKKHQVQWLGDLAADLMKKPDPKAANWRQRKQNYTFTFARGFLDTITAEQLMPGFAALLGKSESAILLRRLILKDYSNGEYLSDYEEGEGKNWGWDDYPQSEALAKGKFPNLREFKIAERYPCHIDTPGLQKFLKNAPRLEILHLESHDVEPKKIFKISMPNLKSLTVHHGSEYPLGLLASNKSLGNLESLACHPHAFEFDDSEPYIGAKQFTSLCRSKNLTGLKHVSLTCTHFGDAGIKALIQSGMLMQLKTLNIVQGAVTDVGANLLAGVGDFGELEQIDLSYNYLTKDGVKALKEIPVKVEAKGQYSGDPNDEDAEHLWHGDIE